MQGQRYGIDNEALVGACFLPSGFGNLGAPACSLPPLQFSPDCGPVGSPIAGHISDVMVIRWREKRGTWYPEDRLKATISGSLIFAPLSVLGCGLVTRYVEGPVGLVLCLFFLFVNGVGVGSSFPCYENNTQVI